MLNSNFDQVGRCEIGSEQAEWLREDLEEHPAERVLAYWHKPRFSSRGNASRIRDLCNILYDADADVVVSGNRHHYERLLSQDPGGMADLRQGIRQFIVGTGGLPTPVFDPVAENSEVRIMDVAGVIKLTLLSGSYEWIL